VHESLRHIADQFNSDVRRALMADDRERAVALIAEYLQQLRAQLKAQGIDVGPHVVQMGHDILRAFIAGDRDRTVALIVKYEEELHAQLRRQGIETDSPFVRVPEFKWSDVSRQIFRVLDLNRGNTTIGAR